MKEIYTYQNVIDSMNFLKMTEMANYLNEVIKKNIDGDLSFLDALGYLLDQQVRFKKENIFNACVKVSHFPFIKTIEDYDFSFQPSINKHQIMDLCTLRFMEFNENVLFVGTPGTGKTHLSTSIGIEAARNSKSTYFITCKDLLWQLNKAAKENTLERRLKHFYSYSLLIIDELGHDVINAEDANHLFQLLQMRYEKHSTIITTNYNIKDWNKIFPDSYNELDAMLDRFLHHVQIVTINGKSYRRKDLSEYWSD